MHGVLPIDKPLGATSAFAVELVRSHLGVTRAGHAGTLDPLATGLLVVCLGEACKAVPFLQETDKSYLATVRLGEATDTLDGEGEVVETGPHDHVTPELVEAALRRFTGTIEQEPPVFSAIKIQGRRLYKLARAGKDIEAPRRTVHVVSLVLGSFAPPLLHLDLTCGKGFYVRSLARDLGRALGCPSRLEALRRTRASGLSLDAAVPLDMLRSDPAAARERILPVGDALSFLPAVMLDETGVTDIRLGRHVVCGPDASGTVRMLDASGRLIAVGIADSGRVRPDRVFHEG